MTIHSGLNNGKNFFSLIFFYHCLDHLPASIGHRRVWDGHVRHRLEIKGSQNRKNRNERMKNINWGSGWVAINASSLTCCCCMCCMGLCSPGPTMLGGICWGICCGMPMGWPPIPGGMTGAGPTAPDGTTALDLGCSLSNFFHCSIFSECLLMSSSFRANSFFRSLFSSASISSGLRVEKRNRLCMKNTSNCRAKLMKFMVVCSTSSFNTSSSGLCRSCLVSTCRQCWNRHGVGEFGHLYIFSWLFDPP